jgi:hypothetical protein
MGTMDRVARLLLSALLAVCGAGISVGAQWLHQPTVGAPRTRDGKVDLAAKTPRLNGKPDLSGLWQAPGEARAPGALFGLGESLNSRYFRSVLADFPPNDLPLTPEGRERLRHNQLPSTPSPIVNCLPDGMPHGDLLPQPFKMVHSTGLILMLFEVGTTFRQIFMDGRQLPVDPSPTWQGYSVGRWEGDTLVVDTIGFNDRSWLDVRGTPHSEEMRVEERFRRRDYGHLELMVTITDPKTFTRPITYREVLDLMPDTELLEHYCNENEKDDAHMRAPAVTGNK